MAEGHIKLYRQLLDSALWLGRRFTPGQAWVDLLLRANYRDSAVRRGGRVIPVERGQLFTSQMALAHRWMWDRQTVARFLSSLKRHGTLDIRAHKQTSTGYTIITILNYDQYQGSDNSSAPSIAPSSAPSNPASVPHFQEVKQYKDSSVVMPDPAPTTDPAFIAREARKLKERFAVAAARARP